MLGGPVHREYSLGQALTGARHIACSAMGRGTVHTTVKTCAGGMKRELVIFKRIPKNSLEPEVSERIIRLAIWLVACAKGNRDGNGI